MNNHQIGELLSFMLLKWAQFSCCEAVFWDWEFYERWRGEWGRAYRMNRPWSAHSNHQNAALRPLCTMLSYHSEIALRRWRHAMTLGVGHCAFTLTPTSFHAGCWHPERGISVGLPSKDCQRIRSGTEIALRRWRHAMTLGCSVSSVCPVREGKCERRFFCFDLRSIIVLCYDIHIADVAQW